MKYIYLTIALTLSCLFAKAESVKFIMADSAYNADNFAQAIALYEDVIASEGTSPNVYFNLGNAYYRVGKNGKALVNYERALRLDPTDNDIKANIEFVTGRLQDKSAQNNSFFSNALSKFIGGKSSDTWAVISLAAFILLVVGLAAYFFSESVAVRKAGFFASIFLFIISLLMGYFAIKAKTMAKSRSEAIVVVPAAVMSTSPREPKSKREEAMTIHDGCKLRIIDSLKVSTDSVTVLWFNAATDDDNRAWIKASDVEVI